MNKILRKVKFEKQSLVWRKFKNVRIIESLSTQIKQGQAVNLSKVVERGGMKETDISVQCCIFSFRTQ